MRQSFAPARAVRYQFERCRATVAADTPGTREWRRRFWLREGVVALGEVGMTLLGAFALSRLTGSLPRAAHLTALILGSLALSARLVMALGQIAVRFRILGRDTVRYRAHRAAIDAQILTATMAALALWSISEEDVAAAGLLPDSRPRTRDAPRDPPTGA